MEAIRNWALTVCGAAVLCTVLRWVFPDTAIGRQGRMVLPCVFLCALLLPLQGLRLSVNQINFTQQSADVERLESRLHSQMIAQVNDTLLAMTNQALNTHGFSAKKVTADMDIGEDGRIDMGQITLFVDEDTLLKGAQVRQIAEKRLGTAVVLAEWEDNG